MYAHTHTCAVCPIKTVQHEKSGVPVSLLHTCFCVWFNFKERIETKFHDDSLVYATGQTSGFQTNSKLDSSQWRKALLFPWAQTKLLRCPRALCHNATFHLWNILMSPHLQWALCLSAVSARCTWTRCPQVTVLSGGISLFMLRHRGSLIKTGLILFSSPEPFKSFKKNKASVHNFTGENSMLTSKEPQYLKLGIKVADINIFKSFKNTKPRIYSGHFVNEDI